MPAEAEVRSRLNSFRRMRIFLFRDFRFEGWKTLIPTPEKQPSGPMKNRLKILAVLAFAAIGLTTSPAHAQKDAFNEGVRLFNAEQYEQALQMFEVVLRQKPGFVYARSYANKCRTAIAQGAGAKKDLRAELAKIVLPKVSFEDAPIGDIMIYLSQRADELSGGKIVPNFIFKGTPEQRSNTLLNLNLKNVPLTEAIRYIGQLSNSRIDYEEHAIIVDPGGSSSVSSAPVTDPNTTKSESVPFPPANSDPFGN